jgi:hypothetical protein
MSLDPGEVIVACCRPEDWVSMHIFYHTGDRSELAIKLIRPILAHLLNTGSIHLFFFVRYSLGGPHIRLRLLPRAGKRTPVRDFIQQTANQFLAANPSPQPLPEEEIRKQNLRFLNQDPNEHDDAVYPDNCCVEVPFRPETMRYGGPSLLAQSILFFCLSSSRALKLLCDAPANQPAEWLGTAMRLLRRFALGFSKCPQELLTLVEVPQVANADMTARIAARADRIFEQGRNSFLNSVRRDLEQLCLTGQSCNDFEIAACLSRELCAAAESTKHRILRSHLHMTANRLGLRNSDEIYLMRILERSFAALATSDPQCLSWAQKALTARAQDKEAATLRQCLTPAFAEITF